MHWKELMLSTVNDYGLMAIFWGLFSEFIGLPFPGETTLVISGALAAKGHLPIFATLLVAISGSTFGSLVAHGLGKRYGHPLLMKYGKYIGITPAKTLQAEAWLRRYRVVMVLISRYIPGFRHVTPYLTGIAGLSWAEATWLNVAGSLLWCIPLFELGRLAGPYYRQLLATVETHMAWISAVTVAAIGVWWLWRRRNPVGPQEEWKKLPEDQ